MTLKGNHGLNKSRISLSAMMKALHSERQGVWVEMEESTAEAKMKGKEKETPAGVLKLL